MTTAIHLYFPSKEATEVSWEMASGQLKRLRFSPWLVTGCCRIGTLTLPLSASHGLSVHLASPNASQVRVFSVCLCKWFLPVLPDFPSAGGPLLSFLSGALWCCPAHSSGIISPNFRVSATFNLPIFLLSLSLFLQSGLLRPPPCSQLYHIWSLIVKVSATLQDSLLPLCQYVILVQEHDPNEPVHRQNI